MLPIKTVACLCFLMSTLLNATTPARVIIIQADDLGVGDLGFGGNLLAHTPHLDALAAESRRAFDFTVNPVCAPSRATLMTGRHFLRTGVAHVHGGKDFLHPDERTMADAYRAAGWKTAMWGKWHSGRGPGYEPTERGFDEAYAAQLYKHENARGHLNGELVQHSRWSDEVIVDYAINFLERHPDEPALLYLPSMSPHTPLFAPERWVKFHRERGLSEKLATLFAMVSHLDEQIGRLVAYLKANGQWDDTLLVFTSDNGPAVNFGLLDDHDRYLRKVQARRGWKGDTWEGGVQAPLLLSWPEGLKPGTVRQALDQVDLLPTLLDWSGIEWPAEYPAQDGRSRRSLIEQAEQRILDGEGEPIFNYAHAGWITYAPRPYDPVGIPGEYDPVTPEAKAALDVLEQPITVRRGRYKFLLNPYPYELNRAPERVLIDLHQDPGETTNLVDSEPELAAAMEAELIAWFEDIRESPHSFGTPRFIFRESETNRWLPVKTATRLQGDLRNSVHTLRGWRREGTGAEFAIQVEKTTTLEATLLWREPPPPGARFRLEVGDLNIEGVSDGGKHTSLGSIRLPAGDADLTLIQTNTFQNETDSAPPELFAIEFE